MDDTNNKEISSEELIQKWNNFYKYMEEEKVVNMTSYHKYELKYETINFLFRGSILKLLQLSEKKKISNLLESVQKYIHQSTNNGLKKLNDKQKERIMLDEVFDIYHTFESNKDIVVIIGSYKSNYEIITEIKNKSDREIEKIRIRFTKEADYKYLFGVYREQVNDVSNRIFWNQAIFYLLLIGMFVIELFMPKYAEHIGITINNDLISLAIRIILTIPVVWAILFILRSIKEDRKIEQAYIHKELLTIIYENFHNREDVNPKVLNTFEQIAVESLRLNPALLLNKSTAEKIPLEELLMQIVSKSSEKSDNKQGQS